MSKGRRCSFCGVTDPQKFYGHKQTRCGACHNADTVRRYRENRAYALQLGGGRCTKCGYDKCEQALHFHHVDRGTKDPQFKGLGGWSKQRIAAEITGCVLLCANCHAEEHYLEIPS